MKRPEKPTPQSRKFIDAAREIGTNDDPETFRERLKKLVKAPVSQSPKARRIKK